MNKILLVGSATPIQKILYGLSDIKGLQIEALYAPVGQSAEIELRAASLQIPIRDIGLLRKPEELKRLRTLALSWILSINSTIIFPPALLAMPSSGCLNLHPGRLPEYAGLHTHQWAIKNGEVTFGATIHWMTAEVDAGDLAYTQEFPISEKDTGLSLYLKCLKSGTNLAIQALRDIAQGISPPRIPQDLSKRVLYRAKDSTSGEIDWRQPAKKILDFIRAADYAPFVCPTYTPTAQFKNCIFFIRKAALIATRGGMPGEVLTIADNGVTVSASDQNSVLLKSITTTEGRSVSGATIADVLGLKPGDNLAS